MHVRFLLPAGREMAQAVDYYLSVDDRVGARFFAEFQSTLSRIKEWPEAWMPLGPGIRRCRVKGFPHGVIYSIEADTLIVVSVMDLRRHPDSWRDNLNSPL
jgi:hypothetical protein